MQTFLYFASKLASLFCQGFLAWALVISFRVVLIKLLSLVSCSDLGQPFHFLRNRNKRYRDNIIPSKADSVASPNCSLIEISSVQWKGPDQRTTANSSSSLLLKRMCAQSLLDRIWQSGGVFVFPC